MLLLRLPLQRYWPSFSFRISSLMILSARSGTTSHAIFSRMSREILATSDASCSSLMVNSPAAAGDGVTAAEGGGTAARGSRNSRSRFFQGYVVLFRGKGISSKPGSAEPPTQPVPQPAPGRFDFGKEIHLALNGQSLLKSWGFISWLKDIELRLQKQLRQALLPRKRPQGDRRPQCRMPPAPSSRAKVSSDGGSKLRANETGSTTVSSSSANEKGSSSTTRYEWLFLHGKLLIKRLPSLFRHVLKFETLPRGRLPEMPP